MEMEKTEIDAEIDAQNKIIEMLKQEQEKAQKKIEEAKKKLANIKTADLEAAADDIALTEEPKKTQSAGKCEATDAATKNGYSVNTPGNQAKATKYYCSFRTNRDTCIKAANTKLKLKEGQVCNWVVQGGGKKRRKRTLKKRKRKSRRRKKTTRKKRKKR